MTERKNIKVKKDLFKRMKADKGEYRSWPQYFEDQLADESQELESVESSLRVIEERTNKIEKQIEDLEARR